MFYALLLYSLYCWILLFLATLFASLLIRPPPSSASRQTQQDRQKAIDFVLGFLMAGDEE